MHNPKTVGQPTKAAKNPALSLKIRRARKRWGAARAESRRAMAVAQKIRLQSKHLVRQWAHIAEQTRKLRLAARQNAQTGASTQVASKFQPPTPKIATARRVPWRRLQMDELDGPYQLWTAPGEELR